MDFGLDLLDETKDFPGLAEWLGKQADRRSAKTEVESGY